MNKFLLFCIVIFSTANTSAYTYSFKSGDILYNITSSNTVSVTSGADILNAGYYYTGNINIPSNVTNESINYTVSSIESGAFFYCDELNSVVIPNSVTSVGKSAFAYCFNLTSVNLPESLTVIEDNLFFACEKLKSINIPSSVITIGSQAFYDCLDLSSIYSYIRSPMNLINNQFLYANTTGCILYIPSGTLSLYQTATGWKEFTHKTEMDIAKGDIFVVDNIYYKVLDSSSVAVTYASNSYNSYTGNVSIPSVVDYHSHSFSVTSIDELAFSYCLGLKSVTIPNTISSIGSYAFFYCPSLTSIYSHINSPTNLVDMQFGWVNTSNCELFIPFGTLSLYEESLGWRDFTNKIEMVSTGVDKNKFENLKVYPSQVRDFVNIENGNQSNTIRILIYNNSGQKMYESKNKNHIIINVSNYPTGVYWVRIEGEGIRTPQFSKFIKI